MAARLRILTYNVHRCEGRDGRVSTSRIARVIEEQQPAIVALQELDVNRARTAYANQASLIADALKMSWHFFPSIAQQDEHYGNAVLSRLPMSLVRAGLLPSFPQHPGHERRAAIWVTVTWEGAEVHLVNTHFGLLGREQVLQADALLGEEWLADPRVKGPHVLCGDLNSFPGTRAYRRLSRSLHDPYPWTGWPPGTFPSGYPLLRLDHILFSAGWTIHRINVARTRLSRIASDHLPLVVEASLS